MGTVNGNFQEALNKGVQTLRRRDPVLRALIKAHGPAAYTLRKDYFNVLVSAIIGQQISGSAAASIYKKVETTVGKIQPENFGSVTDQDLRASGVSPQKLGYLRSLVEHVLDGRLPLKKIARMADEEVITELMAVKGIGVWTAQMFLMFSLGRLDVLPTGDLGVRKGVQVAYGLEEHPTPTQVVALAEERKWGPYRSIASWYMWRALP